MLSTCIEIILSRYLFDIRQSFCVQSVAYGREGFGGGLIPPAEIPKALQNCVKLNPIVKNFKKLLNLGRQHPKMFGKKAVKF